MPPWEEDPVTYYSPQFGGSPRPATWTPPQPPAPTAGWSPPARRVIVAHAVLWPGAIFLDASARWWLPPFNDVVRNGDSAGWTNAFQQIAFGGILSIPLIVALLMLGRSLARMLVSTALVLLAIGIGSSGYLWLDFQGPLARGVFIGAATSALMLAWIAARRRTMLGLLAVLISLVVPILIKVLHIGPETHAIVWDGQFDLGPALAQFAAFAFAMVLPAWVAVGIDTLTAPKHPHAGLSVSSGPPNPFGSQLPSAPANPFGTTNSASPNPFA